VGHVAEGQMMEGHLVEGQMVPVQSQRRVEHVCTFITESYCEFTNFDITQDAKSLAQFPVRLM
jgi:hypothetical protein